MLRQRLKTTTPELLLNLRRYAADRVGLARTASEPALVARLVPAASVDLAHALASVRDAEWRDVHERLAVHMPDVNSSGAVLPGERRALYALVRWFAPRRVLEIGTHVGASTIYLAAALERLNRDAGDDRRLVTVDIADVNRMEHALQWGAEQPPKAVMETLGLDHLVEFVVAPSLSFLESSGDRFDFIFVDGNHRAATVYREVIAALSRLEEGGLVVLHDVNPGTLPLAFDKVLWGPWLALQRLRRESALEVLPLGSVPWGGTTSLALLAQAPGAS